MKGKIKFSFLILCLVLCGSKTSGEELINVDFNRVVEPHFLGMNVHYNAFTYMPESIEKGMTDELREDELQRLIGAGVKMVRTYYRPDWAMGQTYWTEPNWESKKMRALYSWLQDMKEAKIEVALNLGYWFPRDVVMTFDNFFADFAQNDRALFAKWVSESIEEITVRRGFTNVKYVCLFHEPDKNSGDLPNQYKKKDDGVWQYYRVVAQVVHKQLINDSLRNRVKIIGPGCTDLQWLQNSVSQLDEVIDIYAGNVVENDLDRVRDITLKMSRLVGTTGKPFWIGKYSTNKADEQTSAKYGSLLTQANIAFVNAGAANTFLWSFAKQYFPWPMEARTHQEEFKEGLSLWGLMPWAGDKQSPSPAWNSFKALAQHFGPGEICWTSKNSNIMAAAVETTGGEKNIVVVNTTRTALPMKVSITGGVQKIIKKYPKAKEQSKPISSSIEDGHLTFKGIIGPLETIIYSATN